MLFGELAYSMLACCVCVGAVESCRSTQSPLSNVCTVDQHVPAQEMTCGVQRIQRMCIVSCFATAVISKKADGPTRTDHACSRRFRAARAAPHPTHSSRMPEPQRPIDGRLEVEIPPILCRFQMLLILPNGVNPLKLGKVLSFPQEIL